jgi:AcrR family transcriptional regulator
MPLLGQATRERADAARNRLLVLAAARRLFARHGVDAVSMSDIAREARVGKGTLYRRYPDKATLCFALLDETTRQLQEEVIAGVPSAGEGAGPTARLERLLELLADFVEEQGSFMAEGTRRPGGLESPAYAWQRISVGALLREGIEAGEIEPDADVAFLTSALLAPLLPDVWLHLRLVDGADPGRLKAALRALIPRS